MMQTYIPNSASVVVKSDTTVLPQTSYLYVGGTGHVTLLTEGNATPVLFSAVPVGTILGPLRITKVMDATTATLIVRYG